MKVEFVGQSAANAAFPKGGTARLVNLYREPMAGEEVYGLFSVPGMVAFADLGQLYVRAMHPVGSFIYAVAGGKLYRVDATGGVATVGNVAAGNDASISSNNGLATVVVGGRYFTSDGASVSEPATGAFSLAGSVAYADNYTIITEKDGQRIQWSDLGDPTTLPGLNFSSADKNTDNIVRGFVIDGLVWIFKATSAEIWANTGGAGALAFERIAGGTKEIGLKSFGLIARFTGGAFFIGHDGKVHIAAGTETRPISIPAVETAIEKFEPQTCFAYEDKGHSFLCISFGIGPAWCYDLSNGEWHERQEGEGGTWSAVAAAQFNGRWYAGLKSGQIARFERVHSDLGAPMLSQAVSHTAEFDGQRQKLAELEFSGPAGTVPGGLQFEISGDFGRTYGKVRTIGFGDVGRYDNRMIARNLGVYRQITVKITLADPVDAPILSACRVVVA